MKLPTCVLTAAKGLCGLWMATTVAGCNGVIYDDEGDCTPRYRLEFRYDRNLKQADAFASEVKSVTVCVFDQAGKFIKQQSQSGQALATGSYQMPVDLPPGSYDLVTWAGLEGHAAFSIPTLTPGVSSLDELQCTLARQQQADGTGLVCQDLEMPGALFHGLNTGVVLPDEEGTHVVPVSLTKNTNRVRVVLQHLSGQAVEVQDYRFSIEDANGRMAHDNSLLPDQLLVYQPWHTANGSAMMENANGQQQLQVAVAEFSVGRLVKGTMHPRLVVRNQEDELVLAIPLIDYALLVKGYEQTPMSDQEYLDRQDEYNMTFFLDDAYRWDEVHININGWALVINNTTIG